MILEHDAISDVTFTEEQHDNSTVTDTTDHSDSDWVVHSQVATYRAAEGTESY